MPFLHDHDKVAPGYALNAKTNPRRVLESTKVSKNEPKTNLNEPKTNPSMIVRGLSKSFVFSAAKIRETYNKPNLFEGIDQHQ